MTRRDEYTTVERIGVDPLDRQLAGFGVPADAVGDFHQGVTAVEITAQLDRDELQQRLGDRPHFDRCRPRTIARLRQQLASPG